jgi:two-component system, LuxR family, response regulator FixJ
MPDKPDVALIDDDEAILDSVQLYLRRRGFDVTGFTTATAFLDALDAGAEFECLVTDVRMPGMSGLDLQRVLSRRAPALRLIIITGHGDIEMAVSAIKAGAFDFIEKPIDDPRLAASISEAVKHSRDHLEDEREMAELTRRYAELSERQRQVVELAIHGLSNKEIGSRLGISPRTVEHYRESAMERMQANRFAQLIQMIVRLKGYARK